MGKNASTWMRSTMVFTPLVYGTQGPEDPCPILACDSSPLYDIYTHQSNIDRALVCKHIGTVENIVNFKFFVKNLKTFVLYVPMCFG